MNMIDKQKAQYDACAKRILSHKIILAHILAKCVKEFDGLNLKEIIDCIDGEPKISMPVDGSSVIAGTNLEDSSINEGLVRFDIVFYVNIKDSQSQIIINIEAQKKEPSKYQILNRAIFYVSRLISSQKNKDFIKSNYDDIKRVYSIWICMNMEENNLCHYHLTRDEILGKCNWMGDEKLINIVLLGITNGVPDYDDEYKLHRLLCALFSNKLNASEKINIIKKDYNILTKDELREDVNTMCNLGEGIEEMAVEETTREVTKKFVMNMYNDGCTLDKIAKMTDLNIDSVKTIIDKNKSLKA